MKYHQGRLIDHIRLRVVDLERSRRFYKAVLEALGLIDSYGDASGCDIIGRNFRQPREGLGFDDGPTAHMWRTMIWPNNFL